MRNGCASPGAGKPQAASDSLPADSAGDSNQEDLGPKIPGLDAGEAPRAQVLVQEVERGLQTWHPIFKTIKNQIEVKVEEDKTTEIVIEFEGSAKR